MSTLRCGIPLAIAIEWIMVTTGWVKLTEW